MNSTTFQLTGIVAIGLIVGLATSPPKSSVASIAPPAIEPIPAVTTPRESLTVSRTVTVPAAVVVTPTAAVFESTAPAEPPAVASEPLPACTGGNCSIAAAVPRQYTSQRRGPLRRFFRR